MSKTMKPSFGSGRPWLNLRCKFTLAVREPFPKTAFVIRIEERLI